MNSRSRAVALLLLAGCAADPPLVDVERAKIREAVDAYAHAAVLAARSLPAERAAPEQEMKRRAEYLKLVRSHPNGTRYVDEIVTSVAAEHGERAMELREQERRLLELNPPPPGLNEVVRDRYDREISAQALERLAAELISAD